jgi:PAS domain S-box-containing protein
METKDNHLSLFYEIAMSIGNNPDLELETGTQQALMTYLRKLHCCAGALIQIHSFHEGSSLQWEIIQFIPRIGCNGLNDLTPFLEEGLSRTPTVDSWMENLDQGTFRYGLLLPNFGCLVLIRKGNPLPEGVLLGLHPLNRKLASLCIACQSRRSLRESEANYRRVFESIQDVYAEIDFEDGTVIDISPSAESILGFTREQLLGSDSRRFYVDSEERIKLRETLIRDGQVSDFEVRFWDRNGKVRTAAFSARIEWPENGIKPRVVGTMRDITRRKQAEDALILTRNRLEDTVQSRTARLHNANEALRQEIRERIEAERVLKHTQAKLIQSEKLAAIGMLASGIAHEINNPIQYIDTHLRFLEEGVLALHTSIDAWTTRFPTLKQSGVEQEVKTMQEQLQAIDYDYLCKALPESLQHARDGVAQIASIVKSINLFAHGGPLERAHHDLHSILQNVLTISRRHWKDVLYVNQDLQPELPEVVCVRQGISQVFLNLLINGIHAVEEKQKLQEPGDFKGEILIRTRLFPKQVSILFRDNGVGIPEANLHRIFEPFFTTKPPGMGTGQGLAIAYTIVVNEHGGSLEVRSDFGNWTEFEVLLPLHREPTAIASDLP